MDEDLRRLQRLAAGGDIQAATALSIKQHRLVPRFFMYQQNNVYAVITYSEKEGIGHKVAFEAYSEDHADDRLKELVGDSMYWEYCSCCGRRWHHYDVLNFSDLDEIYEHIQESSAYCFVHLLDGTILTFGNPTPPRRSGILLRRNPDDKLRDLGRKYQQSGNKQDLLNYQMARYRAGLPIFAHDCSACVFLGSDQEEDGRFVDYWACPSATFADTGGPSLIIRLSSEQSDYSSSTAWGLERILKDPIFEVSPTGPDVIRRVRQRRLMALYQQAVQRGLL